MAKTVLELDKHRNIVGGSPEELREAIKNAANLRIFTSFKHNEHIDTASNNDEMIHEVSDFPATYLINNEWACGIMTLRQPVTLPDRFGDRASMSFFMYNENGLQACARPYLDGNGYIEGTDTPPVDPFKTDAEEKPMIHMHNIDTMDDSANSNIRNFIYDFYSYKFLVQDDWTEVLAHDENGNVISGSAKALDLASNAGCEIKIAISGICDSMYENGKKLPHELFIETGPHYYYSKSGFMVIETRPFVRVYPEIPMTYKKGNWDFGWAIARSDGHVAGLFYDPYTLKVRKTYSRHAMRWFVRNK